MGNPIPSTSSTSKKRKKKNNSTNQDDGPSSKLTKQPRTENAVLSNSTNQDDDPSSKLTKQPNSQTKNVALSVGNLKNSLHGIIFQSKLLIHFLLEGIDAGYDFRLATERPDLGGKFDDIVFKFWPNKFNESEFKIRFVQAKHKQSDSETLTATDLLNTNDGDFSLLKYFKSFRQICKKNGSENVQDVVICSNAGLDQSNLVLKGFSLIPCQNSKEDRIFTFGTFHRIQLKGSEIEKELRGKLKQCSLNHILAYEIVKCFTNEPKTPETKAQMTLQNPWFKLYHFALVNEGILEIEKTKNKFMAKLSDGFKEKQSNLSSTAKEFHDILCKDNTWETLKVTKITTSKTFGSRPKDEEAHIIKPNLPCDRVEDSEIDEFFKKLFFVKVPNEVELGKILTLSIGKRFGLKNSCLQSSFVLEVVLNWFKTKESEFMSAEEGLNILKKSEEKINALQYTFNSLHYQESFMEDEFSFRSEAIRSMASTLKTFLDSSEEDGQVLHIFTLSCQLSCLKLHFALQHLSGFEKKDSYWMLPYSDLKTEKNFTMLKDMMKATDSPNLLIIVCDDDITLPPNFKASDAIQKQLQKVILIGSEAISEKIAEKKVKVEKDEIHFLDLNEESQARLLNVSVNFQGEINLNVSDLIQSEKPTQVIDSLSLLQLYLNRVNGIIVGAASPVCSHYDENLYINRRLVSPFPLEEFESRVREAPGFERKFKLSSKGSIEWMIENDEEQIECWKNIKDSIIGVENHFSKTNQKYIITESELLPEKWKNSRVIIVSDIPGIGKSALLTHIYGQIKKTKSYEWVVRINLIDCTHLFDVNVNVDSATNTIDFLINNLMEASWNSSHFAKTLFRYRLLNCGEVVLLLDGFDEMQDHCQVNAVRWMRALMKQTKVNQIYVTTRPHMKEELENQFFQISLLMQDFSEADQEQYLTNFWTKKLESNDERISQFAESLVVLAKKNLDDGERVFSGVPLHCRMLAECFLDYFKKGILANGQHVHIPIYLEGSFDRVSLFRLYWKTKCKILQEEKRKIDSKNAFNNVAEQAESIIPRQFFQKLAIDTLFDENSAKVLWDKSLVKSVLHQYSNLAYVHGLTEKNGAKQRFPHLMSAEYFVADFVICTFEDEERSESFDKVPIQDLIFKKILVEKQFKGVRLFLDGLLRTTIPADDISWPFASKKELSSLLLHEKFNSRLISSNREEDFSIDHVLFGVTKEGHSYVLGWVLYCAKEAFTRHSKGEIPWNDEMLTFLDPPKACRALRSAYENIGYIFKRFLLWFEGASKKVLIDIINEIFTDLSNYNFSFRWSRLSRGSELRTFLNFIERNREKIGIPYLNNLLTDEQNDKFILTTLLWSYGKVAVLIEVQICELVLYGLRNILVNCPGVMTNILERWFRWSSIKTRVTMGKISHSITDNSWTTPSVFEHFPCLVIMIGLKYLNATLKFEQEEVRKHFDSITSPIFWRALTLEPLILTQLEPNTYNAKVSLNAVEERDVYGLTPLQRAAMCGDVEGITNILKIGDKQLLCNQLTQGENRFTPLYLAVSCCNEEACLVILKFLKCNSSSEIISDDLLNSRGCLYRAISDAQDRRNIDTERVIGVFLNVFGKTFGKKPLLEFLMNGRVYMDHRFYVSILKLAVVRDMHDVISKMVEIYSNEKSLSDLAFKEDKSIILTALAGKSDENLQIALKKTLENILYWKKENVLLEFIFETIPIPNTYNKIIDIIVQTFCCSVVQEFTVEKLFPSAFPFFLQLLTSKRPHYSGFSSVWTEFCTQPETSVEFIINILKHIPDGEQRCVILHNDGEGQVIALAKKWGRDDVVDAMRSYVIQKNLPFLQEMDTLIANVIPQKNPRHELIPSRSFRFKY